MRELSGLERFLRTDPRDVGCDEAMAVLHIYVDLVARRRGRGRALPRGRRSPAGLRSVR
jgi:hypothetical protein